MSGGVFSFALRDAWSTVKENALDGGAKESNMVNWNKVVANMGRGMDPMRAYNRAEREEREEHRRRMERLHGKPQRGNGR